MFPGQVNVGSSVSLTVTMKVQALVLPLASVAVQVTVVTPLLKLLPLTGRQDTVAPWQLSLAVGVTYLSVRAQVPRAVLVLMFAGQVNVVSSVSLTLTVNEHVLVLPLASVAVQVTVGSEERRVGQLAGRQGTVAPGQLSLAVGVT